MILEVTNLSKRYLQGTTSIEALTEVSFSLEEKKTLSVVGPSGSGKTTLLTLLAGLDRPSKGEVKIAGTSLNSLSDQEITEFRGRHIGIIFQQFHLMPHLTALENVCLPLEIQGESKVDERAKAALDQVGLAERIHHFPHQLSGGENQRVAIARATVLGPKLLLADEPSGNLDMETGEKVMDLLLSMVRENSMSLVLVTHDPELSKLCSQELHLVGGLAQ